jgi:hypothetical protein
MLRPDIEYQTLTRVMTGAEVLLIVDDDPPIIDFDRDAEGNPTRGSVIGHALTCAIAFAIVGYFILA